MRGKTIICLLTALLLAVLPPLSLAEAQLDLSQYSIVHLGDRKLVYQGPGKDYYRDGSAGVGADTNTRVYGYSDGWMLIGYVYSTDNFRVGWVETPQSGLEWVSEAEIGELSFDWRVRPVADDCAMTFDPVFVSVRSLDLNKGDPVTVLCYVPKKWAYVEAVIKGKPARGFIYADMVSDSPLAADVKPLSAGSGKAKSVMKNMTNKVMEGNYAVFSGPGEGYSRAQSEPFARFGTRVTVHGAEGSWVLISFSEGGMKHFGYLPLRLLPNVRSVKDMTIDRAACAAAGDIALRDAPQTNAAFTARVPAGTELVFLCWSDKHKEWALVEYVNGNEKARGFVHASQLDF